MKTLYTIIMVILITLMTSCATVQQVDPIQIISNFEELSIEQPKATEEEKLAAIPMALRYNYRLIYDENGPTDRRMLNVGECSELKGQGCVILEEYKDDYIIQGLDVNGDGNANYYDLWRLIEIIENGNIYFINTYTSPYLDVI